MIGIIYKITMLAYWDGLVYIIKSPHCIKCYGGSTTDMDARWNVHKDKSNTTKSKFIIDAGDAYYEIIEYYPCNSKLELEQREQVIRDILTSQGVICINKNRSGINVKANINAYNKEYRENNKAQIKAYRDTEQGKAYRKTEAYKAYQKAYNNTEEAKAYRKTEAYKAYQKAYRENHKQ